MMTETFCTESVSAQNVLVGWCDTLICSYRTGCFRASQITIYVASLKFITVNWSYVKSHSTASDAHNKPRLFSRNDKYLRGLAGQPELALLVFCSCGKLCASKIKPLKLDASCNHIKTLFIYICSVWQQSKHWGTVIDANMRHIASAGADWAKCVSRF